MEKRFFPLSAITKRINELLEPAISKQFWVKAEISTGRERGGAFYCDLVETNAGGKIVAKIACTIWQSELATIRRAFKAKNMDLVLSNGTVVGFLCSLQFSPQYGLSLRVIDADPSIALGEMELKKRDIIERLQKEGMFETNKELSVPLLPLRLGLITSAGSAAYNDFIQTLTASGYGFKVFVADAMMQGDQTEKSVMRALDALARLEVDLVSIVRGGGSKTDLYFLDNEAIARRIAGFGKPVWTGIGHEIDTSVLDYVANRSFKTPTAAAEELVARFIQMRRQLDEATNTLQTVWTYRLKLDRDYLTRAMTGIRQGSRKLLDVTASFLREQAKELRLKVQERLSTEQVVIGRRTERLRSLPMAMIQNLAERLAAKRQELRSRTYSRISRSGDTLSVLKQRFVKERFLRRLLVERDSIMKVRQQLKTRFLSTFRIKSMTLANLKGRLKEERILLRFGTARNSLNDKMAILKAIDPQTVLQRGFALVYGRNGALIRSINDVTEKEIMTTRLTDGSLISEVIAKEKHHE
ncbi:exodeoxyribonuclease VII large subunit [Pelobacter propionicus]|uniref:Exodeoxyribonuclease 7 large subunit n=1 Tax=Pelobacter propionicus (strain DSM 2379 / NBRC 103807 / OttBd1) TaxID=338966 RepID=A1AKE4_PELPD|nr:exodeoxyribonuclease VII large subunit [Pelobacter propionicus]ABK97814.1 Exodeoxyribonuclease VII large subunit [Pelobacter propionicus DSM 2379]